MSYHTVNIIDELIQKMNLYMDFEKDPENCDKFLSTLDDIVLSKDPSSLPLLINLLDDKNEKLDAFCVESLMNAIEAFPEELHITEFLKCLQKGMEINSWGIKGLSYGMLNSPRHLEVFKQNIHLASKKKLLKFFDEIVSESPKHTIVVDDLRKYLAQSQEPIT